MIRTIETKQFRDWLVEFDRDPELAVERMIGESYEVLREMARRMLRGYPRVARWEDTDDVCQLSTLRVCSVLRSQVPESLVHFFRLAGIQIRRTLIDLARKHAGACSYAANHDTGDIATRDPSCSKESSPASLADWSEFHQQIADLPPASRQMFDLLWYGGLSQDEAAMALGIDRRSVQRRWRSARILLSQRRSGTAP